MSDVAVRPIDRCPCGNRRSVRPIRQRHERALSGDRVHTEQYVCPDHDLRVVVKRVLRR